MPREINNDTTISGVYGYIAEVAELNRIFTAQNGRIRTAHVMTYGCQQNEADSENLRGLAIEMGYKVTDDARADLVIVNTCAIREHAEQRVFGNIGALSHEKRKNPDMIIAMCGCMAGDESAASKIKKSYPYVGILLNTFNIRRLPEAVFSCMTRGKRFFGLEEAPSDIIEGLPRNRDNGVKAWLPVMTGCDNFCSYCIVPYVRGRERSRKAEDVYTHACQLISDGAKDITLLGQNVNSYGKDTGEGINFAELLKNIAALDGDFRLRFMTSHPKDANINLFETMAQNDKIAKCLHLPFQSGSDGVLRAMNRGYTSQKYKDLISEARRIMPGLVVTSDVIVGFPGETYEDFTQTLELIREIEFDALFTFIYSPRSGTKAADMPDPANAEQKQQWFDELLKEQNAISAKKHSSYVGKTVEVLIDGMSQTKDGMMSSRTDGNRLVVFPAEDGVCGKFRKVKINGYTTWSLTGELI